MSTEHVVTRTSVGPNGNRKETPGRQPRGHHSADFPKTNPTRRSSQGSSANTSAHSYESLRFALQKSPIIPATRTVETVSAAVLSPSSIIFIMCGSPASIDSLIWRVKGKGKLPIVNLDLLPGLARDLHAVEFLAEAGAAGVISTHQDVLRAARSLGLIAVQRTFAIDSAALSSCLRRLQDFVPDILELLPAFAGPIVLPKLRSAFPELLVIGCGLITSLKQAEELLQQGMISVSVCNPSLWVI
jgi:glycerol uptake operon antiterminator